MQVYDEIDKLEAIKFVYRYVGLLISFKIRNYVIIKSESPQRDY